MHLVIESVIDSEIDFKPIKEKLKCLILEYKSAKIPVIDDNYTVQVLLKDHSTYAYTLRRFALQERRQIREITDNYYLLVV